MFAGIFAFFSVVGVAWVGVASAEADPTGDPMKNGWVVLYLTIIYKYHILM